MGIGSLNRSVGMAVEERIRVFVDEERARDDTGQKKRWPGENKEAHMRAALQGLDAPGYSTGDTEGDAAQAKRARGGGGDAAAVHTATATAAAPTEEAPTTGLQVFPEYYFQLSHNQKKSWRKKHHHKK